jgi:hypothetical protein
MFKRITRVRKKKKSEKEEGKKGTKDSKDSPKPGKTKKVWLDIFGLLKSVSIFKDVLFGIIQRSHG